MELLNNTGMEAGYTMGMQPDGRELLVIAVKGTFQIPRPGEEPRLADNQAPLVMADTFTGEPGFSAPVHEVDFAPRKPRCDILLNGCAYAPSGRPVNRVDVGLKVGDLMKTFTVTGNRHWRTSLLSVGSSKPEPFLHMPLSYDNAFGGIDNFHPDKDKEDAYRQNPVGRGYHKHIKNNLVDGTPMPNTEELNKPIERPNGAYQPMAFGSIGRGWVPRIDFAGTYDQHWLDDVFPFLPADFDERYYQSAPADQQCDYLRGGEDVVLLNLTPAGKTAFQLPTVDVPVVFFPTKGPREETHAVIDTLIIEPDAQRFILVWRASRPLKKNMFEIAQVLTGRMSRAWWRARELGKTYYPSLRVLSQANAADAEDS